MGVRYPSGFTTVLLPVTRTAGMSLDGNAPKRKLVPEAPKLASLLPLRPVAAMPWRKLAVAIIRPRSARIAAFLPCAAAFWPRAAADPIAVPAR